MSDYIVHFSVRYICYSRLKRCYNCCVKWNLQNKINIYIFFLYTTDRHLHDKAFPEHYSTKTPCILACFDGNLGWSHPVRDKSLQLCINFSTGFKKNVFASLDQKGNAYKTISSLTYKYMMKSEHLYFHL